MSPFHWRYVSKKVCCFEYCAKIENNRDLTHTAPYEERLMVAKQLLTAVPLIDGHNDLPWNIRKFLHNQLNDFKYTINVQYILAYTGLLSMSSFYSVQI